MWIQPIRVVRVDQGIHSVESAVEREMGPVTPKIPGEKINKVYSKTFVIEGAQQ